MGKGGPPHFLDNHAQVSISHMFGGLPLWCAKVAEAPFMTRLTLLRQMFHYKSHLRLCTAACGYATMCTHLVRPQHCTNSLSPRALGVLRRVVPATISNDVGATSIASTTNTNDNIQILVNTTNKNTTTKTMNAIRLAH